MLAGDDPAFYLERLTSKLVNRLDHRGVHIRRVGLARQRAIVPVDDYLDYVPVMLLDAQNDMRLDRSVKNRIEFLEMLCNVLFDCW